VEEKEGEKGRVKSSHSMAIQVNHLTMQQPTRVDGENAYLVNILSTITVSSSLKLEMKIEETK
jgi:hypothetical protein